MWWCGHHVRGAQGTCARKKMLNKISGPQQTKLSTWKEWLNAYAISSLVHVSHHFICFKSTATKLKVHCCIDQERYSFSVSGRVVLLQTNYLWAAAAIKHWPVPFTLQAAKVTCAAHHCLLEAEHFWLALFRPLNWLCSSSTISILNTAGLLGTSSATSS